MSREHLKEALEEAAHYDLQIRRIDIELDRLRKMRRQFEQERNARRAFVDLYPVYVSAALEPKP